MPWRTLVLLYVLMVFVCMTIALVFFRIGLTLVLPFSGLEMLALGAALYVTSRRGSVREVITINKKTVAVETGRARPEQRHEFQRPWAKVILERSWSDWHPSRLLIRSHGRQLEIGRFLNEQERRGLAEVLDNAMALREA
jgi:uncharacterized membrane protein